MQVYIGQPETFTTNLTVQTEGEEWFTETDRLTKALADVFEDFGLTSGNAKVVVTYND